MLKYDVVKFVFECLRRISSTAAKNDGGLLTQTDIQELNDACSLDHLAVKTVYNVLVRIRSRTGYNQDHDVSATLMLMEQNLSTVEAVLENEIQFAILSLIDQVKDNTILAIRIFQISGALERKARQEAQEKLQKTLACAIENRYDLPDDLRVNAIAKLQDASNWMSMLQHTL